MADIICPILKTAGANGIEPAGGQPIDPNSLISEPTPSISAGPETNVSTDTQTGSFEEGFIQWKNTRVYGVRTYSIILIVVLAYAYLCVRNNDVAGMKDLAVMACGFLFGIKAIRR